MSAPSNIQGSSNALAISDLLIFAVFVAAALGITFFLLLIVWPRMNDGTGL